MDDKNITVLVVQIDKNGKEIKGTQREMPSKQWSNLVMLKDCRWKKVTQKIEEDERIDD